jgi:hypothetical protein
MIRASCAKERSYGSARGAISGGGPRDRQQRFGVAHETPDSLHSWFYFKPSSPSYCWITP